MNGVEPYRQDTLPRALTAAVVTTAVVLTVARFAMTQSLWLDEALSVNIASLPLGEMTEALRRDGHPPLYYLLLGGWIDLFGASNIAVRSFSAVVATATTWPIALIGDRIGGRRLAATTAVMWCVGPFALRYGSEARMYALVMLLVTAGTLIGMDHLDTSDSRTRRAWRPVAVAALMSALLWTHYWGLWFAGGAGLVLVASAVAARRRDDAPMLRRSIDLLAALVVAGVSFIPWLGVLRDQAEHTGTPWADPMRPAEVVIASLTAFFGGPFSEAQLVMLVGTVVLAIGIVGTAVGPGRVELASAIPSKVRNLVILTGAVIAVGGLAGFATRSAFAARYAAIFYPLVLVIGARGLCQVQGRRARSIMAVLGLVAAVGCCAIAQVQQRSQSGVIAEALTERLDGRPALAVVCPDQLGPAASRAIWQLGDPDKIEIVRYADLGSPRLVDWVDYAERNALNDPEEAAREIDARADGRPVALILMDTYLTLEGQCAALLTALSATYEPTRLVEGDSAGFYEPMNLFVLEPKATP